MVSVQPAVTVTSLTNVTVGVPHASDAVTEVISAAGTASPHCTVILAGQEITGGVASVFLIIVWAHVAVLPQASDAVTEVISAAGTASPHCTVILAGQEITGGVASVFLIIVCAHVAVLP